MVRSGSNKLRKDSVMGMTMMDTGKYMCGRCCDEVVCESVGKQTFTALTKSALQFGGEGKSAVIVSVIATAIRGRNLCAVELPTHKSKTHKYKHVSIKKRNF